MVHKFSSVNFNVQKIGPILSPQKTNTQNIIHNNYSILVLLCRSDEVESRSLKSIMMSLAMICILGIPCGFVNVSLPC